MIAYPADPTVQETPAYRRGRGGLPLPVDDPANNQ